MTMPSFITEGAGQQMSSTMQHVGQEDQQHYQRKEVKSRRDVCTQRQWPTEADTTPVSIMEDVGVANK